MRVIREKLALYVFHLHTIAKIKTGFDQREFCRRIADLILAHETLWAFAAGKKPPPLWEAKGETKERVAFHVFRLHTNTDMKTYLDQKEFGYKIADLMLARRHVHLGDPCIYCGTPHDEVVVGDCLGFKMDWQCGKN